MEIKNLTEHKNDLFSRNELGFEVENNVAPSAVEIKELIKKKFSCDDNLIRIRKIHGSFGSKSFKITVNIYNSQEEFNRIVKKTKQEVDKEKKAVEMKAEEEKKAAETAKAEAEAAAAPKEEVVEETPTEVETPVEEIKEGEKKE